MSEDSLRSILSQFEPRIAAIREASEAKAVLKDFVQACARDNAEAVYLTVQTQPDLTPEGAQRLAKDILHKQALSITDTVHDVRQQRDRLTCRIDDGLSPLHHQRFRIP